MAEDTTNPLYWSDAAYPWGQCTYWVLEMRPDLWDNRPASDPDPKNWSAYTWAAHGSLEGLVVNHQPASGAVMVWPRNSEDQAGHVAYVQSNRVARGGRSELITVQEFNNTTFDDPSDGEGDTMTLHLAKSSLARVKFIHEPGWFRPRTARRRLGLGRRL